MKQPSFAEIKRQIVKWRLAKINRDKLWPVDVSKMGLENLGPDSLEQILSLIKTIEFYEERVDVVYESTDADGKKLFHGASVKLKEKKHEDHSKQS